MKVTFFDRQLDSHPANGNTMSSVEELFSLLSQFTNRKPFFFELQGDNGYKELIGFGEQSGCVQYSSIEGEPPYLMALSNNVEQEGFVDFLMGNTPTPISKRYCIEVEKVLEVASHFFKTGAPYPLIGWEEV